MYKTYLTSPQDFFRDFRCDCNLVKVAKRSMHAEHWKFLTPVCLARWANIRAFTLNLWEQYLHWKDFVFLCVLKWKLKRVKSSKDLSQTRQVVTDWCCFLCFLSSVAVLNDSSHDLHSYRLTFTLLLTMRTAVDLSQSSAAARSSSSSSPSGPLGTCNECLNKQMGEFAKQTACYNYPSMGSAVSSFTKSSDSLRLCSSFEYWLWSISIRS